ncbi:hypothetical protein [Amycolatopsis sp. NPDC051128]|uniref:hypothetical protein n=1 Tax=Amycolatopsis sp. NPDC051128 TaxID=3155412 RepID=UPI0034363E1C
MTDASVPRPTWTLLAVLGGVVVLATTGAPQSLEYLLRVGLDAPGSAGAQLAVGACGALATALSLLAKRFRRWLLPTGAAGVFAATALHLTVPRELALRIAGTPAQPSDVAAHPVIACLLAAASGVLLVGLLGAVQSLANPAPVTGIVAAAAYCGVAVTGPLVQAASPIRLTVTAVAVVLTAGALTVRTAQPPSGRVWPAAVVVVLPLGPTVLVALTGKPVLGTATGSLLGLSLVALALAATGGVRRLLAVAAAGLVLAAPAMLLLFLHTAPATGHPWYAWPLALLGVLAGGALARRLTWAAVAAVLAAGPMMALGLRTAGESQGIATVLTWVFVVLALAAVSATTGAAAPRGQLPEFAALVTTAAVGFASAAGLFTGSTRGVEGLIDEGPLLVSAGYVVVAAVLLMVLARLQGSGPQTAPPQVSGAAAEWAQQ